MIICSRISIKSRLRKLHVMLCNTCSTRWKLLLHGGGGLGQCLMWLWPHIMNMRTPLHIFIPWAQVSLPDTPKNWILLPKWKTIYNVELILLLNKALHTYMNFKLVLSCFHNQVMQYCTLLHIILIIIIITHITHNIITTHSTLLHIILVRYWENS